MEEKEMEKLYKNKEWLYDQYYNNEKSMLIIAKECECGETTIEYWMKKFDFKRKSRSETSKGKRNSMFGKKHTDEWCKQHSKDMSGENHVNWGHFKSNNRNRIHSYIKRRKIEKNKCEWCNKEKKLELSFNHDLKEYTRNPKDYLWLCKSCHSLRDWGLGVMNNQFTIKKGLNHEKM